MRHKGWLGAAMSVVLLCSATAYAASAQDHAHHDEVKRISVEDFKALLAGDKPVTVIDVREGAERKIKGAVVIPVGDIESRLKEIPRDHEIVTYCA